MNRLEQFRKKHAEHVAAMQAILSAAGDDGALSADQQKAYDELEAKRATVAASIKREEALAEAEKVAPAVAATPIARVTTKPASEPEGKVFATLGDNLAAIVTAGNPTMSADARQEAHNRLVAASAPSGASTQVGADGGFLIQKDFAVDLMNTGFASGALASRCSVTEISGNSDGLEVAIVDETSRATGSRWGGVQVYRRSEADDVASKKPKLGKWDVRLEDIMGLAYLTERLMNDASAMAGVFQESFVDEFAFKLDDEIFRGTGSGECMGIVNAGCTVSHAAESGQGADTVIAKNVTGMWSRVLPRSKTSAAGAWFVNAELGQQLLEMYIATGVSGQLVYMPPNGLSGQQHASLFGKPVIEIEHASAKGDVGDISYLDLAQYKLIRKGGIEAAESMHVRFIYAERTLRWLARVNGAPKLRSAITPYKGANTLSPFVTLAAR